MSFAPSSPVSGGAQTGFTSPTYTLTVDVAPETNGKQYAVTSFGGTQVGVIAHSVAAPFTALFVRPKTLKVLGMVNPVTGKLGNVPNNVYFLIVKKGVLPLAGQAYRTMTIRAAMDIPAGSDLADAPNIKAAVSLFTGLFSQQSAGIGDTLQTGIS